MASSAAAASACPLCDEPGGVLIWRDADWRVVRVEDAAFPAYYRMILNRHCVEFSELALSARNRCMALVCAVESVLLRELQPTKINLAAFGNMVPHLHWHVIARFDWDSHFPQPIWGAAQREVVDVQARLRISLQRLDAEVARAVGSA